MPEAGASDEDPGRHEIGEVGVILESDEVLFMRLLLILFILKTGWQLVPERSRWWWQSQGLWRGCLGLRANRCCDPRGWEEEGELVLELCEMWKLGGLHESDE